jgi:DNA topoisomerase-3
LGKVDEIEFKVTGRTILDAGWRTVYAKDTSTDDDEKKPEEEERTLPVFVKGESGEHIPTLTEKMTTPPPYYTEATLLRAMETAGKLVDDETLRAALKENGIGRPSTRAAIIETLFKRHYIRKDKKRLVATPTGMELIDLIREELLKSAELTGIWEKKLRDIEAKKYDAQQFIEELKQQITEIVRQVLSDPSNRRVTIEPTPAPSTKEKGKSSSTKKKTVKKEKTQEKPQEDSLVGQPCPICGQGHIIKGKTAYGCSRWKEGCTYRKAFEN